MRGVSRMFVVSRSGRSSLVTSDLSIAFATEPAVRVSVRRLDDGVQTAELSALGRGELERVAPWRQFRWYRGQQHFSGSYWSSTMSGLVGYESRLELAWLLFADYDPAMVWMCSQPFLLEVGAGRSVRRHVPDFLVEDAGGQLTVVDVKPRRMLERPEIADGLAWWGELVRERGWEYEVFSEPDPVRLANVRFLAGYRRSSQFDPEEVQQAGAALSEPMPIRQAVERVRPIAGDTALAQGLVLHLTWLGVLRVDLDRTLGRSSVVVPA